MQLVFFWSRLKDGHLRGAATYLNLDKVDWLEESWLSSQHSSVQATSGSWDDLTATSVDSVSVEGHIIQVEADTTDVFVSHWTLEMR